MGFFPFFFFSFFSLRTLQYPIPPINDCSQGHISGNKLVLFHARSKRMTLKKKSISIETAIELASTQSRLITYVKVFCLRVSYFNQSKKISLRNESVLLGFNLHN